MEDWQIMLTQPEYKINKEFTEKLSNSFGPIELTYFEVHVELKALEERYNALTFMISQPEYKINKDFTIKYSPPYDYIGVKLNYIEVFDELKRREKNKSYKK